MEKEKLKKDLERLDMTLDGYKSKIYDTATSSNMSMATIREIHRLSDNALECSRERDSIVKALNF